MSAGWVYVGSIAHHRAAVRPHGFRSPAFLIGIDLAELPAVNRRFRWLGHNRIRPLAIWDRDYLGGGSAPLRTRLARWLPGLDDAGNTERVVLVTTPRVLHYAFNPISVFYCIGRDGGLTRALAEVHSTYGEGHVYPLPGAAATVAKELFVSPFFGVDGDYAFELRAPDERLALTIRLCHAGRTSLAATLEARGRPLSDAALLAGLVRRPLTAALAYPRIVWQGLVLRYLRGLSPRMRPPALGDRTVVRVPGRPARRRAR